MNLTPKQEQLAVEIAYALGEMDNLQAHRKLVAMYSEEHLRSKLTKTLSVPQEQIKKSRGALYTSLVQGYGKRSRD